MRSRLIPFAIAIAFASASSFVLAASNNVRGAETYDVDAVHSAVIFKIQHFEISNFYGRFNDISGTFTIDDADPAACRFEIEVKVASVDTNNADRDKHLRNEEIFAADKYPTIRFVSTKIKDIDGDEIEVEGELTMHGVTKPLSVELKRIGAGPGPMGGYRMGLETTFKVKRSDFGVGAAIDSVATGVKPLGDEVTLIIGIEAVRQ
jgi:polyisoprenoid-binding protein YceI